MKLLASGPTQAGKPVPPGNCNLVWEEGEEIEGMEQINFSPSPSFSREREIKRD
jgi:hypothetical protein